MDEQRWRQKEDPIDPEVSFLALVEIVVRQRWLIAAAIVCGGAAALLHDVLTVRHPIYTAEKSIFVLEDRLMGEETGQPPAKLALFHDRRLGLRVLEKRVPQLQNGEVDSIVMRDHLAPGKAASEALRILYQRCNFAEESGGLFTISVRMPDSLIAIGAAEAFVSEFTDLHNALGRKKIADDMRTLERRISTIERELRAAEDSLLAFKGEYREALTEDSLRHDLERKHRRMRAVVETRTSLLNSLLQQREHIRLLVKVSRLEVRDLGSAVSQRLEERNWNRSAKMVVGSGAGLVFGLLLAFFVDAFGRSIGEGELERIRRAYRG